MSDLNQQPGLFDDLDDAPLDEPVLTTAQPTMLASESIKVVPLLTYLTDEHRVRVVDVKLAELLGSNPGKLWSGPGWHR